jgi:hypothetical protein
MGDGDRSPAARWAGLALCTGGLLMAALWLVFTSLHGPTSFDEHRFALGRDELFWGMLLGVVPNLLIAAALLTLRRRVTAAAATARVGYAMILAGLVVSAALDLVFHALGPPLVLPIIAGGLILLAIGNWRNPLMTSFGRLALLSVGIVLTIAFALVLVPIEVADSIGGYRIFGALGYLVAGIGWALFGAAVSVDRSRQVA